MDKIGVVHGRFQLFHNDHLKYVLTAKQRCEHLIIGICNPDVTLTKFSEANPHRSKLENNPFTYYERMVMIRDSLIEAGIKHDDFDIVPFPINYPEMIFNYAPQEAKYYLTIYDAWGEEKKQSLQKIGCNIEVLWKVNLEEKGISGSNVRKLIIEEGNWQQFVPPAVYKFIKDNGIDERIRNNN